MTPQLMQAIKLLQLSNLDLAAYVEGELERNPLLERVEGEGEGERRTADGGRFAGARTRRADWIGRAASGTAATVRGTGARWRADLDDVPPADTDAATSRSNGDGAARLFRMGRHRQRRPRGRRLQSRSLRLGRDHACRSSRRAARARDRRSRAPHDRAIPDRHGRRGRLPQRRSRDGRRKARRAGRRGRGGAGDPAGLRSARACARAISRECLAIQLKERDRFDPAMAALVAHLDLLAKRDLAALRRSAA